MDASGKLPKDDSSSSEKDTLLAVLQFLKKNNLSGTEALLKKEANITEEDVKQDDTAKTESDVSQALAAYKSEGDATLYETYYRSLEQFVEKSLDVHKCELSLILYPVFVHMYLELVFNNHEHEARQFFDHFSPHQEAYYTDDLTQLSTVFKAEHMRGNQLLDNFKSSKFTIRMSRDSYNHLKRHLLEKKQTILLNIVQDHLFIDVFDGAPRTKLQIDATAGGMSGEAKKDANKAKVYYGLLKEPDINIPLDDDEEASEQTSSKKKKAKKDPSLLKKSKNDPNAPSMTRIPLPEMRDIDKLEKVRSVRESMKRVPVGPENLPSICFYTLANAYQGVTSVSICDDSSLMAAGFGDSRIKVWSLTPLKLRGMKPPDDLNLIDRESDDVLERMMDDRTASDSKALMGHNGPVYSTSFTPDRSQLLSCSEDGTVRLWSLQTWSNLVCYKGHVYPVWDAKFGPYGHYFISSGHDRTIRLWSTDHYQPLRLFVGHLADVDCIEYHPNSNYIASGSADRTVRLWDVASGNCVRIMTGHKGPIHSLAFTPDGRYLASAGKDNIALLWDIASGDLVGQLRGHTNTIYSMCFSREGSLLATGGMDNSVRLWDVAKVMDDLETEGVSGLVSGDKSSYEVGAYPTKSTPVLSLHYTRRNLLLAAGPYTT